jgi:hypothetical protein
MECLETLSALASSVRESWLLDLGAAGRVEGTIRIDLLSILGRA